MWKSRTPKNVSPICPTTYNGYLPLSLIIFEKNVNFWDSPCIYGTATLPRKSAMRALFSRTWVTSVNYLTKWKKYPSVAKRERERESALYGGITEYFYIFLLSLWIFVCLITRFSFFVFFSNILFYFLWKILKIADHISYR